jgi:hypothetical protein
MCNKYNILKGYVFLKSTNNRYSVPFISTSGKYLTEVEYFSSIYSFT